MYGHPDAVRHSVRNLVPRAFSLAITFFVNFDVFKSLSQSKLARLTQTWESCESR